MTNFKRIAATLGIAGALGLSGLAVNAQTDGGMMNCPHMGKSGQMGMMKGCHEMMKDCPMMDEDVSFTVNNTEQGMIVEWTAADEDSIEKIQKMGEHMRKMKQAGSEGQSAE